MAQTDAEKVIRVLLAEGYRLVRHGLRRILEEDARLAVVGEAGTGLDAIKQCNDLKPDVVVINLSMPGVRGLEATEEILKENLQVRVLILSMQSNRAYVRKAFDLGAKGYILGNAETGDLTRAVIAVAEGEAYISPGISQIILDSLKAGTFKETSQDPYERLTRREKEVLQLIAEGNTGKEIARLLQLSESTVAVHRSRAMQALGLHRTAQVVLHAVKNGLIQSK
jgi:two-component system, NarL family, response regulator NreC